MSNRAIYHAQNSRIIMHITLSKHIYILYYDKNDIKLEHARRFMNGRIMPCSFLLMSSIYLPENHSHADFSFIFKIIYNDICSSSSSSSI